MKALKLFGIGIFFTFIILLFTKHNNSLLKLDGYSGLILPIILVTDDSEYSKKYSHDKFLQIENGMSITQVYHILGEPIRVDKNSDEYSCLWYSWSPNSTHYSRRNIIFKKDKVSFINSEYYID